MIKEIAIALGLFIGAWVVAYVFKNIILQALKKHASKTRMKFDDYAINALDKTHQWFFAALGAYVASFSIELQPQWMLIIKRIFLTFLALQVAAWGSAIIDSWITQFFRDKAKENPSIESSISIINLILKVSLYVGLVLFLLHNYGINITTLIAGLGVGGLAVALAVQNILGDLLSSLSIVLDKPFEVGDFIINGDHLGTVEKIGLKTTRLRSISGEQIVISNSDLLGSRIRNYKRLQERRVVFAIGVTYETTQEKLERIPKIIEEIIKTTENVRFDRSHFKSFGDFSLDFETVFYTLVPDFVILMDAQQSINYRLFKRFAEEGIDFAYPTQQIFYTKNENTP